MTKFTPRQWQQECHDKALQSYLAGIERHFLCNATPGAGKTFLGAMLAATMLNQDLIERVIVIAPRANVVRKWGVDFELLTGKPMMKITQSGSQLARLRPFVCATWNAIKGLMPEMQAICQRPTLVIADEHHHAAIEAAWGNNADGAFAKARYVLATTGTPLRSDGKGMVWFGVDCGTGRIGLPESCVYTLGYERSIEEGYCRPMVFIRHPGRFTVVDQGGGRATVEPDAINIQPGAPGWMDELVKRETSYEKLVRQPQLDKAGQPLRGSYHESMFNAARRKLDTLRASPPKEGGLPSAGGLVVAPSILVAEYLAKLIGLIEGTLPLIVHSERSDAEEVIDAFREDDKQRWLVSVDMVSEGVDMPRLRVIVNLSDTTTELYFRQLAGRAIRTVGVEDVSHAYMIIPEISILNKWAYNYEDEQGPVVRKARQEGGARPRQPGAGTWTCAHCDAINALADQNCHACGEPRQPVFIYTVEEATGWAFGAIKGGRDIPEDVAQRGIDATARLTKGAPEAIVRHVFKFMSPEEVGEFLDEVVKAGVVAYPTKS